MKVGELIEAIGPLNNRFRQVEGFERIDTLWEVGDVLQRADSGPLDDLLWQIQEKSFITRDVLRYASIIRRSWPDRAELRRLFGQVTSYSLFREALPLLKGDREGITEDTYRRVIAEISGSDTAGAKRYVQTIKHKHIGRQHRKGVSRAKVNDDVQAVLAYKVTLECGLATNPEDVAADLQNHYGANLGLMGKVLYALASEGTVPPEAVQTLLENTSHPLVSPMLAAATSGRDERSAFVKAVSASLLMDLADLFVAAKSKDAFSQWKRRSHISLRVGGKQHGTT